MTLEPAPKSTLHQGSDSKKVWEHEPSSKLVWRLPSAARSAVAAKSVDDCNVGLFIAMFDSRVQTRFVVDVQAVDSYVPKTQGLAHCVQTRFVVDVHAVLSYVPLEHVLAQDVQTRFVVEVQGVLSYVPGEVAQVSEHAAQTLFLVVVHEMVS
mmetsp:Transcript_59387/g.145853  ORF Transcript_59387/g.145853 Transcript_59387/m.145853 type:complete len:153 (+) Transcript_59387:192-650(+)|eukprot:CAMPEP_0206226588 /NCGR_PEP_ID=MMETSP0047_2-20121206/8176_1 /ASSEMBLY_ACC=CAM_ASM_000192 /TAXON_ID=195065 /ORGANISM="Chroomonas mesostigmatica_cf, Strain CCMP1168" /LENGTH=152 /DNA_ID=CAMNT_0053649695 /DNA_START=491 /DNA_END=949 /DNA_ORIENTATION=+